MTSVEDPLAPKLPGVMRAEMFKAMKVEQIGKDLHQIDFCMMDIKGFLAQARGLIP